MMFGVWPGNNPSTAAAWPVEFSQHSMLFPGIYSFKWLFPEPLRPHLCCLLPQPRVISKEDSVSLLWSKRCLLPFDLCCTCKRFVCPDLPQTLNLWHQPFLVTPAAMYVLCSLLIVFHVCVFVHNVCALCVYVSRDGCVKEMDIVVSPIAN